MNWFSKDFSFVNATIFIFFKRKFEVQNKWKIKVIIITIITKNSELKTMNKKNLILQF